MQSSLGSRLTNVLSLAVGAAGVSWSGPEYRWIIEWIFYLSVFWAAVSIGREGWSKRVTLATFRRKNRGSEGCGQRGRRREAPSRGRGGATRCQDCFGSRNTSLTAELTRQYIATKIAIDHDAIDYALPARPRDCSLTLGMRAVIADWLEIGS